MAYRNKVYVAFDGDTDMRYYRLMRAWKQNDRTPFNFYDAHDLNSARDMSLEESIKAQLRVRMQNSKIFVLLSGMGLVVIVFISTFAGAHKSSSANATQWPFDPSGYFYVKEKLPEQFEDFHHVILLSPGVLYVRRKEAGALPRSGVYTSKGEVYEFRALNTRPSPDHSRLLFEFATATLNSVSYKFAGEFLNSHIFEEFVTDTEEIVAKGKLLKLKDGNTVAEALVQFTYSAKPRGLHADVNAKYPSGMTDLMYAAMKGDIAKVQTLLAEGANVNSRDPYDDTALMYVLRSGRAEEFDEKFVRTLIAAGANVNLAGRSGETALICAAYRNGWFVKILLAAGADPNARDENGRTALMHVAWAVDLSSPDDVKALIRAGANVNLRDKQGRTALSIARKWHNDEIANLLKQGGANRRR